ncbi:glycerophosphodiester phosphodiesterase family protein [Shimia thalassica]|uniref:glycerophosphodiester phosphodiesterase family protein n=1 Tax=Shimia thalassica TaxID=1715693 RepID=UPI0026E154A9|nr:glycerophosphodiester phosphodiesterase family protein [Shimia thalassica]MDO6483336.1 glycerophosphodiester phosphodiesterase family protein [Shimia thalassica]
MTFTKSLLTGAVLASAATFAFAETIQVGPRPAYLIDRMPDGALKDQLAACESGPFKRTDFSIGHRGAPLQFPEHTVESNRAAALMGAGILECDVTFTKDKELVCRHAQNDLHTTTNILATDLAETCVTPFTAANGDAKAKAECRTSEITLADFRTLRGKMDAANKSATTVEAYLDGTAGWRTDLYSIEDGTLMTHAESIALFKDLGAKFTPELKSPAVEMPFDGFTQEMYAQKMIDEYKAAGIPAKDVFAQSFNLDDVLYWIKNEPEFGKQAVFLDGRYNVESFDYMRPETFSPSMQDLADQGVNFIAPPMWMLVTAEGDKIVASPYAKAAKDAGLKIVTWTLERSGPLTTGGGWYFQSVKDTIDTDADYFTMLHALHTEVGIEGIFSDWPATVTYYASCMNLN